MAVFSVAFMCCCAVKGGGAGETAVTEETAITIDETDVDYITYNNNSAPPDTPVETYTDRDEIKRILEMFESLKPVDGETDGEEVAPGDYSSYTVHLKDGTTANIGRGGEYVYYNGSVYHRDGYFRLQHKDCSEFYIGGTVGMPKDMKLEMTADAYDRENTVVTGVTLKHFDGKRWNTLQKKGSEFAPFALANCPEYFDLSEFEGIVYGDYNAEFEVEYPSGKIETVETWFTLFEE